MSAGVSEFFWRIVWLLVCIALLTYMMYLYVGSTYSPYAEHLSSIAIVDIISRPGEHHLSGAVNVPSVCHGLSVRTDELSKTLYQLTLTTWQEPTRTCETQDQMRSFQTVVFAPSTGVSFVATLDGENVPITITTRR